MIKSTMSIFGLLVVLFAATNSCTKCPACPPPSSIVTDDSDTLSFRIVTDDSDTLSFKMAAPVVTVDGKVEKASIVIDNVDMARMIIDDVDTTKYKFDVRPRQKADTIQRQK
jgi:hypothetical protein